MDRAVVVLHHVEYHRVIGLVCVVAVAVPVAGAHVYLHVAAPHLVAYAYLGVEKVGPGVAVELAHVDYRNAAPVVGGHLPSKPEAVAPHILHQLFHRAITATYMSSITFIISA